MTPKEVKEYLTKEILKCAADCKPDGMNGTIHCILSPEYDMICVETVKELDLKMKMLFYIRENGVTCSTRVAWRGLTEPVDDRASEKIYRYSAADTRTSLKDGAIFLARKIMRSCGTIYEAEKLKNPEK